MRDRSGSARRLARRRDNARALLLTFGIGGAVAGPIVLHRSDSGEAPAFIDERGAARTQEPDAPAAKAECALLLRMSLEEVKLK